MTPDEAIAKLKTLPEDKQRQVLMALSPDERKGILGKLSAPTSKPRTVGNYLAEGVFGVGRGLRNDVEGVATAVAHPIKTAQGVTNQLFDVAIPAAQKEFKETEGAPLVERGVAAALSGLEEAPVVGPMVERAEKGGIASPESFGAGMEAATTFAAPELAVKGVKAVLPKRSTAPVKGLVKETQEANATETAKAAEKTEKERAKVAEKNADQVAQRKVDLRKHFDKTQATVEANRQAEAPVARKSALNRGVDQLSTKFQESLSALRKKVNAEANAKYGKLNAALDSYETSPAFLPDAILEASEAIKGSNTEPTILRDMEKRMNGSEPLTYRDLQGYYSELGRELQRGTLPGDVYHAYDVLQERIGDQMQTIANEHNLGPQLQDARATWRQMKQTFYDPKSPLTKSLKAGESTKAIDALQGKDQTGIEALAKYDPELARQANTIRGYQSEARSLPSKPKALKSLPKLEPKPAPIPEPPAVKPDLKKIGTADIRAAKEEALHKTAQKVRSYTTHAAMYVTTYRSLVAIGRAMAGDTAALAQLPPDLAEGAAIVAGGRALGSFLENPKVVDMLTKATPKDVAEIPPDMRGDLSGIVQAATRKGIKVSPSLLALTGATAQPKRVAAALTAQ